MLNVADRTFANVVVLSPSGRIDHNTADAFQDLLSPHVERCIGDDGQIVLDLSKVDYMSSVGLRVMMAAAKTVRKQEGNIVVAGLGPTLQEIFEISRFEHIFRVFDSVRDGVRELSEEALEAFDARMMERRT